MISAEISIDDVRAQFNAAIDYAIACDSPREFLSAWREGDQITLETEFVDFIPPAPAPRTPAASRPPWGVIGWSGEIVCYELVDDREGGWIIEARLLGSEALMDVSLPLASAVFADAGKDGMTLGDLEGHRELRP